jgi:succinoglycan biosynthesis transport protein ExoP
VQTNEQLYQGLLARMKEANVASTMISSNVAVIAPAEFPYRPYRPRKKVNVLVAALVGLVGGVGLAFLVERLDSSIKNVEEMEQVFSKPNLGIVPLLSRDNGAEPPTELFLASHSHPRSLISESIRQVRTAIMLSSAAGPPGTLMITSANPNEGKTTLALNLAISLTLNARKVAVIDCDLRKPSIHALFQEPAAPGLSDFLTGNARFSDISKLTKVPGMVIIPAGTIPPSPPDLFASEAFKDFVKRLRQYFQLLIFDTPPVTMFADAQVLSPLMDGILVVCKHHSTTREAALHTKRLLLQVNGRVLGTILNMAAIDKMGYGYGYPGSKHYLEYYAENTQSRSS